MTLPRRKPAQPRRRAASAKDDLGQIVVSSRIRLARNLAEAPFPDWAPPDDRLRVFSRVVQAALPAGADVGMPLEYAQVSDNENLAGCLYESHYISRDLLGRGPGAGYLLEADIRPDAPEHFSMMINEEDHIRIQVFRSDYQLEKAWKTADRFDTALERRLGYAFSKKLGYLTACPSNLGTGMRASVMLALPGLVACDEFESTCRAVDRLGFNARGVNGENTSTSSCLVQISNRGTLGFSETDVIARLKKVVDEVIRVERQARLYSLTKGTLFLNDMVSRGLAVLQGAYVITAEEAQNAITCVRLGVSLGMVRHARVEDLDALSAACGHYALRQSLLLEGATQEEVDDPDSRDASRADLVRNVLARASFHPLSED